MWKIKTFQATSKKVSESPFICGKPLKTELECFLICLLSVFTSFKAAEYLAINNNTYYSVWNCKHFINSYFKMTNVDGKAVCLLT